MNDWENCRIGSCQRHQACMYGPCRSSASGLKPPVESEIDASAVPTATVDAFWARVQVNGADECWPWQGGRSDDGYGRFFTKVKVRRAHRFSLELTGVSIPPGEVVDHICRNRACVNPAHLRAVDRRTNVFENSEAPAAVNAGKTQCLRGHPLSGDNLYVRKDGKRECRKCCALRQKERYHAAER